MFNCVNCALFNMVCASGKGWGWWMKVKMLQFVFYPFFIFIFDVSILYATCIIGLYFYLGLFDIPWTVWIGFNNYQLTTAGFSSNLFCSTSELFSFSLTGWLKPLHSFTVSAFDITRFYLAGCSHIQPAMHSRFESATSNQWDVDMKWLSPENASVCGCSQLDKLR